MKFKYSILTVLFFILVLFLNFSLKPRESEVKSEPDTNPTTPKNIILMIGDGMGFSQITSAIYKAGYKFNIEKLPITGLSKTASADNMITDSAAAATAIACGEKTFNGAIGVDVNKSSITSIMELAAFKGKSTGLLVSSTVVHATPASFLSHQESRQSYEDIACDMFNSPIDVMIGGGQQYFQERADGLNLLDSLKSNSFQVIDSTTSLSQIDWSNKKIAAFTAKGDPKRVSEGRDYLPKMVKPMIENLNQNPNGFFMLIEGSQIDWGGHANEIDYVIEEMIDFDNAIGEVLNFIENDPNTLLVITADHETGGLAINPGSLRKKKIEANWSSTYHTAVMVPVFSQGPGSPIFSGTYPNNEIFHKMKKLLID